MPKNILPEDRPFASEVKYEFYTPHISHLEGRMLTLVDASISDPEQRKALKDLFRQDIWTWAMGNNQATHDPHNHVDNDPDIQRAKHEEVS